jgi:putative membrane protein
MALMYSDHMGGSDWGLMVLWMILLIMLAVGVIWAITSFAHRGQPAGVGGVRRSGREILDERLARGEIDPDEYDRLRDKLDRPTPPQNPTPG